MKRLSARAVIITSTDLIKIHLIMRKNAPKLLKKASFGAFLSAILVIEHRKLGSVAKRKLFENRAYVIPHGSLA